MHQFSGDPLPPPPVLTCAGSNTQNTGGTDGGRTYTASTASEGNGNAAVAGAGSSRQHRGRQPQQQKQQQRQSQAQPTTTAGSIGSCEQGSSALSEDQLKQLQAIAQQNPGTTMGGKFQLACSCDASQVLLKQVMLTNMLPPQPQTLCTCMKDM